MLFLSLSLYPPGLGGAEQIFDAMASMNRGIFADRLLPAGNDTRESYCGRRACWPMTVLEH